MTGTLSVGLEEGRQACLESVRAFVSAAEAMAEVDLLAPSRCLGWTRLDVVVHVAAGWQEMLAGLVSQVEAEATTDAAAYWPAFAAQYGSEDPIPAVMGQRRRTAAFGRPAEAVAHLGEVADSLVRGVAGLPDRRLTWQELVFRPGDFLAIWAVEDAVHHLDLLAASPPPAAALALTRATVQALCPVPLPEGWSDVEAALVGTGRAPLPDGLPALAGALPVLG